MPRDDNAFTYQKDHLTIWLMPDSAWKTLPEDLKNRIKAFQHSGAAVLTSLERLDGLRAALPPNIPEVDEVDDIKPVSMPVTMEDKTSQDHVVAALEVEKQRRESAKEKFDYCPVPLEHRSFGSTTIDDTAFPSDRTTPYTNVTSCPSPLSLMGHSPQPVSPNPLDIGRASRCSSIAKVGPPMNAQIGHYYAQLVHLRETDSVRLRHNVRNVDLEIAIHKNSFSPTASAETIAIDSALPTELDIVLQVWWPEKKALAETLWETCNNVDAHVKPNLGWSDVAS